MIGKAEIIVIRETDETGAARLGLAPRLIDGNKEGIVLIEIGFTRKAEAFRGIVGQAFRFLHVDPYSRSGENLNGFFRRSRHENLGKSGREPAAMVAIAITSAQVPAKRRLPNCRLRHRASRQKPGEAIDS
jgi:hypothetical protein